MSNKIIQKVNKKAFKEIRQIQTSSNMLEVESAINNAIHKTFGLWDLGLQKIAMRKGYNELCAIYGCITWNGNFELMKAVRYHNFDTHKEDVKQYLISFIPERMKVSLMYKKITGNV